MEKERLDCLLVEKGFFSSREKARACIMSGNVFINGNREDKPGTKFDINSGIEIKQVTCSYVSRGGLKLKKAIDEFGLNLGDKKAMDVGASTGGFTDCMLKHGAQKVISVDVGYGQLAWELRSDSRVFCMERVNIRYVTSDDIPYHPNFVTVDVSFISLKKVIPPILSLLDDEAELVCLIKPQFEAGREKVGKKGVVREITTHIEVVKNIVSFFKVSGIQFINLSHSPIKGPEGNIEFLIYGKIPKAEADMTENMIEDAYILNVISEAHNKL